jgi:putative toxin-antitoxin system antitoxin component (TIGR02293 family)
MDLDHNDVCKIARQAEIYEKAAYTLGSQEAMIDWLRSPAMALDNRRPFDLMNTLEGLNEVDTLLIQMEYGVYV